MWWVRLYMERGDKQIKRAYAPWDGRILEAVEEFAADLMRHPQGSPERIQGATLFALVRTARRADALADAVEREVTPSTGGAAERLRVAVAKYREREDG